MSTHRSVEYLTYPLRDGFVANWLVAGPHLSSESLGWDDAPGIEGTPVERGPIDTGAYRVGENTGTWAYHACPEDRVVDLSGHFPGGHHIRSWAYAELAADEARTVTIELTASGRAGVWLDGAPVLRVERGSTRARIHLPAGTSQVMVRFETVASGETAHTAALRIEPAGVHVQLPSLISDIGRRTAFEQLTAGTFVERDVYEGGTSIVLQWPDGDRAFCPAHLRLHGADDAIYALADVAGAPGDSTDLGYALQLPAGPMRVTLMPAPDEVYLRNTRIAHHLPFWSLGRQRYAATPAASDLTARRGEALSTVAEHPDSVYGQIARMVLGAWQDVDPGVVLRACARSDDATLVVLLGMVLRFGTGTELPEEISQAVESAVCHDDEWSAPGPESSRILRHAGEILAGQRYPDVPFADGQTGSWHRGRGERLALEWMSGFAGRGSAQPGAAQVMEQEAVALSHLADLGESPAVYEMAAVCLDKLLFLLALHSRQGVLGAASSAAPASFVKSGLLQPTAPISRLLWGSGVYNHHQAGVLSLASATGYEPPALLEAIAQHAPDDLWSRERHAPAGAKPTSIVTFKTPEYMLSSLADVQPESAGHSELMWRATLGPDATVFVNQPGSSSESDSRMPGLWAGNARTPRVGQWRDALIAMHHVAETDVFAWTHAYFPCATFDEYVLHDGWAFARVGDGYLALTSSVGLALTGGGRYALRELRAVGPAPTWLVQMGRAALDGDFSTFQAKVLRTQYGYTADTVNWTTVRGDRLQLAWSGPLSVNGRSESMAEARHIENAYAMAELPCTSMDIRLNDDVLRLDFTAP